VKRLALLAALALVGGAGAAGGVPCNGGEPTAAYRARVDRALRSGQDLWGEALTRSQAGPTYAGVSRLLEPLVYARQHGGRLTSSGVYYVPFGQPTGPFGAGIVSLHVADGSEIRWDKADGASLKVAAGNEAYGSCLARLSGPTLADGYLPILETSYTDGSGRRYRQESFATGSPLSAYVHLSGGGRLRSSNAQLAGQDLYAAWSGGALREVSPAAYEQAREATIRFWAKRLAEGRTFVVPERRVLNAERALLIENVLLGWRYSSGNAYEEFSYPESPDVAGVMGEYGFQSVERATLAKELTLRPSRYPNWQRGETLLAVAREFELYGDRRFLATATPTLARYVSVLERAFDPQVGLLERERYSSDIPDQVYGLHAQAMIWQGLNAIAAVWRETGRPGPATRAQALAAKLGRGLLTAVRTSQRRLPDGSLFVPTSLLDQMAPYRRLTESRPASYWNLVMPYALASRLLPPGSLQAEGVLRYVLLHGSRLLGLTRAGAFSLYGKTPKPPASGTDNVYELNMARFLADADRPDELVLSLYGALAAGMTHDTFAAGEAGSIAPLPGSRYRSMYLPPNSAANASFLETLRLTLVHESATGLELAYATPRGWLRPGARISVAGAPTAFGPVSLTIDSGDKTVRVRLVLPARARTVRLRLRLPRPHRITFVSVGRLLADGETIDLGARRGVVGLTATYR
jgi:hypothetical protein